MTAISVFLLLCLAGVFVLAMRRASIWVWTLAAAAAVLTWRTGLIYGNWHEPAFNLLGILAWVPVVVRHCRQAEVGWVVGGEFCGWTHYLAAGSDHVAQAHPEGQPGPGPG